MCMRGKMRLRTKSRPTIENPTSSTMRTDPAIHNGTSKTRSNMRLAPLLRSKEGTLAWRVSRET